MSEPLKDRNIKNRCVGNKRNCRACGRRYEKGDTRWQDGGTCPVCSFERRCPSPSLAGRDVCRMHGGGSPLKGRPGGRPPKDGVLRRLLPRRMLEAYDEAYEDARLTELRRDIALMETRRVDLIKRADVGESGAAWKKARETWKEMKRAKRDGYESAEFMLNLENDLDDVLGEGLADYATWREIGNVTNELRKLKVDETRRLKDMSQMLSTEKVMALIGKVVQVIEQVVQERERRAAIAFGIKGLLETASVVEGEFSEAGDA